VVEIKDIYKEDRKIICEMLMWWCEREDYMGKFMLKLKIKYKTDEKNIS
jgi:hypothetical protein